MAKNNDAKRPLLISLIGYLYMLGALAFFLMGILFFLEIGDLSQIVDPSVFDVTTLGTVLGGSLIVAAIVLFVIAKAFLDGWTIAWYLGVILNVLGIISGLVMYPTGLMSAIISAVITYYLFRPAVKEFFKV